MRAYQNGAGIGRRSLQWLALGMLIAAAALQGCSAGGAKTEVTTDHDWATDFDTFRTWDWLERESSIAGQIPADRAEIIDQRVKAAVEFRMDAKGYVRDTSGRSHMVLLYHVALEDMTYQTADFETNALERSPDDYTFKKGTLIIDIADRQNRKLIWRGHGTKAVEAAPREDDKVIRSVVDSILKQFPPKG